VGVRVDVALLRRPAHSNQSRGWQPTKHDAARLTGMIVVSGDLDIDTMLVDRLNLADAIATFTPDDNSGSVADF
jgi:hypothetical protein